MFLLSYKVNQELEIPPTRILQAELSKEHEWTVH